MHVVVIIHACTVSYYRVLKLVQLKRQLSVFGQNRPNITLLFCRAGFTILCLSIYVFFISDSSVFIWHSPRDKVLSFTQN